MSELLLTLADCLGDRQRHLADDLRLMPTDLVLSRADSTRSATHSLFVAQEATTACPVTTVLMTVAVASILSTFDGISRGQQFHTLYIHTSFYPAKGRPGSGTTKLDSEAQKRLIRYGIKGYGPRP